MTLIAFIFQIIGMATTVFLVAMGIGLGLRLGLGRPDYRRPDQRKDKGVPF